MRIFLKLIAITLFFLFTSAANAQKLDFFIIHRGDTVGVLNVERKQSNNTLNYKLYSKVEVTFIVQLVIINNMTIVYENGKLMSADVLQKSNKGVFDANVKAKYERNRYHVIKNGSDYYLNEKEITWSVSRMYFEEPKGVKSVYAEDNGKIITLEPKSEGQYSLQVSFPSVFTYKNGIMVQMIAETIVGDIYFVRNLPN